MSFRAKVALVMRTLRAFMTVERELHSRALPQAVSRLADVSQSSVAEPIPPRRLGALVYRILRVGPYRPRCLVLSMVLYRLLSEQGTTAEVVIGLPPTPASKDAHAWIEIDGFDVGPPPGRGRNLVLARYS